MRLLECKGACEFDLTKEFFEDDIPKYAILSHTWGADTEEVSFKDMIDGMGKGKRGYNKIRFCGEQAKRHRLQYFWVDTCCIDKSNSVELSEAINSMFQWYRNATKCYVYLADVSKSVLGANDKPGQVQWELAFRQSRWFTRGWTLQELIAPTLVEFFSGEGELLGDKESLGRWISEITGIPVKALQASHLSDFSIDERLSWQQSRQTRRKEDKAYSLLGICGVHMPLIYGEGSEHAFKRLHEEIGKTSKGTNQEDFSLAFSLSEVSDIEHFVGRKEELEEIHRALSGDGGRRTVVLYGLGGIGKTQLAVAYAKQHKDSYSAMFWLDIRDENALKQSFAKLARQIVREHPLANRLSRGGTKEDDLDEIVDAVKAWLSLPGNTRWLMIYDNYDNPKVPNNTDHAAIDIRRFLPESYQGSVIVTTRSSQVTTGHAIRITKLGDTHDSLQILSNASRRQRLLDDPDAVKLAKKVDGFPLALATAGAYLHRVAVSCSDYLRLYEESWSKLQKLSPGLSSYEDRTLHSTWQISYDRIEQQNKLSAMLLRLWAYFDNHDLWFELLRHTGPEDPEWIRQLTEDELTFHAAVAVLTDHGLVEADTPSQRQIESRGYSMHPCVHSWTIHVLNQEWDQTLMKLSFTFVALHNPEKETAEWWLTKRRLLNHAARCTDLLLRDFVADDGVVWAYHNLGNLYMDLGKLGDAEKVYQRALHGCEKALDPEHTLTLDTVNNLGNLYADLGRLNEAEEMYQRALQGYEKALGLEHTSTLNTVNNLGILYRDLGRLAQAKEMFQRALQGYEKALGLEHISTLNTVNNLGILYRDLGRLDEAEEMFRRALQGKEKALGLEHISTLTTVNNLGNLYVDLGRLNEAEEMYQRALQEKEKALGLEHTSTLNTVNSLGNLYQNLGRLDKAEEMYQRALQGKEKAWGLEHISTLGTVNNIGNLYQNLGRLDEAEEMYQRALQGCEKALGLEHTSTLGTVNNLGILYRVLGRLDEAEEMYQRALQGYEKALGPQSLSSYLPALNTIYNMGLLFTRKEDKTQASEMYLRALAGYRNVLGVDHKECQNVEEMLGALQISDGEANIPAKSIDQSTAPILSELWPQSGTSRETQVSRRKRFFQKLGGRR